MGRQPPNNTDKTQEMIKLKVAAKLAAALNNVEDKEFSDSALDLLQSLESTVQPEEKGLDESELKFINETPAASIDAASPKVDSPQSASQGQKKGSKSIFKKVASFFKKSGGKEKSLEINISASQENRSAGEFSMVNPMADYDGGKIKEALAKHDNGPSVSNENDNSSPRGPQM